MYAVLHLSLWKSPIFGVPKLWFHWAYHNNPHSKTTSQATQLKDMQYFICVLAGVSLFYESGSWVNTISQKFPMKSENLQGSYRREKTKFPDISLTFPWHKFKFPWRKRSAIGKTYFRRSCYLLWDNSFDSCNLGIFYVLQRHFTI